MFNKAFSDLTSGLSEMNATMSESFMTGIKTANEMAPHNLLSKMAIGSGQFNAKMTTEELNSRNIY